MRSASLGCGLLFSHCYKGYHSELGYSSVGRTPCKLGVFVFLLSGFLLGEELNPCGTTLIAPRQTERFVVVLSLSSFKELPPVAR